MPKNDPTKMSSDELHDRIASHMRTLEHLRRRADAGDAGAAERHRRVETALERWRAELKRRIDEERARPKAPSVEAMEREIRLRAFAGMTLKQVVEGLKRALDDAEFYKTDLRGQLDAMKARYGDPDRASLVERERLDRTFVLARGAIQSVELHREALDGIREEAERMSPGGWDRFVLQLREAKGIPAQVAEAAEALTSTRSTT